MKYNQTTLNKLESIPVQVGYILRYERGTFQSGFCILEQKKVIVLNKFLPIEGRVNTLLDLITQLEVNVDLLTAENQKLYYQIINRAKVSTSANEIDL